MFEPNDRIYHKKWETPELIKIKKRLTRKLEIMVPLNCSIPLSWAEEIEDLLDLWENQHGIAYTKQPYWNSYNYTYKEILLRFWQELKRYIKNPKSEFSDRKLWLYRAFRPVVGKPIRYLFGKFWEAYRKPTLHITQIKEKWGTLRVYYDLSPRSHHSEKSMIEYDIKNIGEKLTKKGVYFNEQE